MHSTPQRPFCANNGKDALNTPETLPLVTNPPYNSMTNNKLNLLYTEQYSDTTRTNGEWQCERPKTRFQLPTALAVRYPGPNLQTELAL
eukprot:1192803-Prorocentrum_minimum.AAC.2